MFIMPKTSLKLTKILNKADAEAANKINKASIDKLAKSRGIQIIEAEPRHVSKRKK